LTVSAATLPIAPPTRPVVLLVEDDDPVRELIGRALRANGFEVVAAASGEEALDLEHDRHVDLLLSDVLLPNQNGFEVANQIRARSPHIPVVFMSGYYDQAVAEAAHLDISSTILQKPFAMADLLEHLRAAYAASKPLDDASGL
jgi:DNA-binding response OmpR family regulator